VHKHPAFSKMTKTFHYTQPFVLESGDVLPGFHLGYTTLGSLNDNGDNVVWIFHALTANSDPSEWWYGLVGDQCLFDPAHYFIVCVNMPGSCYGSISPLDHDLHKNEPYYHDFPLFTTRDMVRAYRHLKLALGIQTIMVGLGGSMGGQQLLEWAIEEPGLFEHIIPIATNAKHSPWGIAFNATQRFCIETDPTWQNKTGSAGIDGMKVARAVALLSYRNYHTYTSSQQGSHMVTVAGSAKEIYKAETYQQHQGEKLAKRFNAFSYYFLSKSMDSHDLGRGRGTMEKALQLIKSKTLVISIQSDLLFPTVEQEFLAENIPSAKLAIIDSHYGHDGFLLEFEKITELIIPFLGSTIQSKESKTLNLKHETR
jgi:homoserine O-acetyltransferase/O-succinyltransferase